jgi:hydrogenase nickel incorporation protein HypA/HybF
MHELAITESIVDCVAERVGGAHVVRVVLEVGALAGAATDALRFSFDVAARGTSLEGAELAIEETPGRGDCASCGPDVPLSPPFGACACGRLDVRPTRGTELRIREVEVT